MKQTLEILMIVSFGFSWPFSLAKSIKSKSAKGKSLLFLLLIDFGYACGVAWKVIQWVETGHFVYPVVFYTINLLLVSADTAVYFRNRRFDKIDDLVAAHMKEPA